MSICRWVDKDVVQRYNGILPSHKKWIMPFEATWMDLESITLSKLERERWIPYDITYAWDLKYDPNRPIYETETDSQR